MKHAKWIMQIGTNYNEKQDIKEKCHFSNRTAKSVVETLSESYERKETAVLEPVVVVLSTDRKIIEVRDSDGVILKEDDK